MTTKKDVSLEKALRLMHPLIPAARARMKLERLEDGRFRWLIDGAEACKCENAHTATEMGCDIAERLARGMETTSRGGRSMPIDVSTQ